MNTKNTEHRCCENLQADCAAALTHAPRHEHRHLWKTRCVTVIAIIGLTLNAQGNVLNDLFQWAAQQPQRNAVSVRCVIATNEVTNNNLVSFREGILKYHPAVFRPGFGLRFESFTPAFFASEPNGIVAYFSERRWTPNPAPGNYLFNLTPFNPNDTDLLTVSVGLNRFLSPNPYISIYSKKWKNEVSFAPGFDAASNVLYGTYGNVFYTVSFGYFQSMPPI